MWHCQEHEQEFETQPDYIEHLETIHTDGKPELFSSALVAAVVGPSLRVHRDCPFCPSGFSDVVQMQSHLIFHLERLAQLALPLDQNASDDGAKSVPSSQSQHAEMRGRQDSVLGDFDTEEDEQSFDTVSVSGTTTIPRSQIDLTEKALKGVPAERSAKTDIRLWAYGVGPQGGPSGDVPLRKVGTEGAPTGLVSGLSSTGHH